MAADITKTPAAQAASLADGCADVVSLEELEERIARKGHLTVKFGVDPSGSELHLGHAVVLHKMREFQDFGHRVILLIGDFTALIGDPTGRNEQRKPISREQIEANMLTYREQAGRVLDIERLEIMYNSSWLRPLGFDELLRLTSQVTVARMLERNDFAKRYAAGLPISLHELLYPVAQAYDSVAMAADVELGGTEQLFNFMLARAFQEHAGQPPQICMTSPILEGLDGERRMGKSLGNYVSLVEPAEQQFGKLMSLPDAMIPRYARLAAFRSQAACRELGARLAAGTAEPMAAKKELAEDIVALYHGRAEARTAREYFERTVQRREAPAEMPEFRLAAVPRRLIDVLVSAGLAQSKREAERLVAGGGVRLNGEQIAEASAPWEAREPVVLSVGSRRFVRVLPVLP
ncbi:tyrosine--tRNA ligase [bacterium]|nr:MAG: tyrosine--tRNA ligase [bacterium]